MRSITITTVYAVARDGGLSRNEARAWSMNRSFARRFRSVPAVFILGREAVCTERMRPLFGAGGRASPGLPRTPSTIQVDDRQCRDGVAGFEPEDLCVE